MAFAEIAGVGEIVVPDQLEIASVRGGERPIAVVIDPLQSTITNWEAEWTRQSGGRGEAEHWAWGGKVETVTCGSSLHHLFAALVEGDLCHAMMIVSWPKASRGTPRVDLLYVEYIEVAPLNRHAAGSRRDLKGTGAALLALARHISDMIGFNGRIALNSLPGAENFYRSQGMNEFEAAPGDEGYAYFELVDEGDLS